MAAVHPILSIGLDLPLLFTRAAVLKRAGYEVVTASPATPSIELLLRRQPPLVIICHTVTAAERAELTRKVEAAKAPLLLLDRGLISPEHLLDSVQAAIAGSPPAPVNSARGPRLMPHA